MPKSLAFEVDSVTSVGLDRKLTYYGIKLGPNSVRTDEGFRIYKDCVVGRTGTQVYKLGDVSAEERAALGVIGNDDDEVTLWRDAEEVFDPATIASFEGKSVTDEHPDNGQLLDAETAVDYHEGHIQNIRRGAEPLDNGDWPLLADIHIISERLIAKIDAGIRQLSLGYKYHLARLGNRLCQVDIRGNHVAVVPKGRAGPHARLLDSAPTPTPKKEHHVKKSLRDHIVGLGLAVFAKDASPEETADAARSIGLDAEPKSEEKANDSHATATDLAVPGLAKPASTAKDADGGDYRGRMHSAVDRLCDEREKSANSGEADLQELSNLLNGMPAMDAEKDEKESKGEDAAKDDEDKDDEDEEPSSKGEDDGASVIEPFSSEDKVETHNSSATDAVRHALDLIRPHIARSRDPKLKAAFDSAARSHNNTVRKAGETRPSYAGVAKAAAHSTATDSDPYANVPENEAIKRKRELDAEYAAQRVALRNRGGK